MHPFPLHPSSKVTGSQTLKLVHDRFKGKAPAEVMQEFAADMASAAKGNREISQHLGKAMEDLSALRVCVRCRLRRVTGSGFEIVVYVS